MFAKHAIMRAIGEERWNLLRRNVEYHLDVSDVAGREGFDEVIGSWPVGCYCGLRRLRLSQDRAAIEALEAEEPGLGVAFYWTLTYALYRVMRIYNHDEALRYEERLQEYAEETRRGTRANMSFPKWGKLCQIAFD